MTSCKKCGLKYPSMMNDGLCINCWNDEQDRIEQNETKKGLTTNGIFFFRQLSNNGKVFTFSVPIDFVRCKTIQKGIKYKITVEEVKDKGSEVDDNV